MLTLPPVSGRSLVGSTGSSNLKRWMETSRPQQAAPPSIRLAVVPGSQTGQKGKSARRQSAEDLDLELDEEKLRAHQFWVAWGRQVAADMLKSSMEVGGNFVCVRFDLCFTFTA